MLTEAADVNSIYEESLSNLRDRVPIDNPKGKGLPSIAEKEQAAKDYYANVRTNLLLTWVLSNVSPSSIPFMRALIILTGSFVNVGRIAGSDFGRHEIHRCVWPRCRNDEGQKLFNIHSGVHSHYQLRGESITYLFLQWMC
jgi:hypothetical protein